MVSVLNTIDTGHEDMIHDAEIDYYGLRLATCSSDNSVKIYDIKNGAHTLLEDLKGHFGPVWQIAWSHPKFGNLLASCSYDRKVIIWKEMQGKWNKYYEYANHDSSLGSSDGSISILTYQNETNTWDAKKIPNAHAIGCNAVSWCPAITPEPAFNNTQAQPLVKRLVSGGCDNLVKIWREDGDRWVEENKLEVHSDWDRRVIIWTSDDCQSWNSTVLQTFDDVVWNVSWSLNGNILAVSGGDNKITLWKQSLEGSWQCISDVSKGQGQLTANEQRAL
ncbi:nuclear pore complex protein sec13 / seh1 family member [Holotrichia oblita]|uniref:Nuclear pore complex protein sec13 / seh1 family member n=1 Tax=Holotrichia oblita TaxID=644536 RepID=A0ACB9TJ02_HOLOL|nr:nuclear pore complex protein sec13 / seh1 family member [Holotrichia oblita]